MNSVLRSCLVGLSVISLTAARAGEQPRIFDLREVAPRAITVAGKRVLLVLTGEPPHILTFTNLAPSNLKRRDEPDRNRIQVTYGKDVVGFARVLISHSDRKAAATRVTLAFETVEQAAAAGKALGSRDAPPSPLRRRKDGT